MAWQVYDDRSDKLIARTVRCPYCKNRIAPFETACSICGIKKTQIAGASNAQAKKIMAEHAPDTIVLTRRRPHDIKLSRVMLSLCVGFAGAHNFYVGRRVRGWIMLTCFLSFFVSALLFPETHSFRLLFVGSGLPFVFDVPCLVAILVWVCDVIAIVAGTFKYPVRLAPVKTQSGFKEDNA